jgi:glycosyltransferase involved in cell wall biosynthesis
MHFWLVSAFEPIPSDGMRPMRFMGLADQLLDREHQVVLWTTSFSHHRKRHRFDRDTVCDVRPGYQVVVLRSWGYKNNVSLRRFLAHRHFAQRLQDELVRRERPDAILISVPPLDSAAVVLDYGAKHNVPVVVDVIDPWPDAFLSLVPHAFQPSAQAVLSPWKHQARDIFQRATAICAVSNSYLEWAQRQAPDPQKPRAVFYPAVNIQEFDRLVAQTGGYQRSENLRTRMVYAGALSNAYDLETVVQSARRLADEGFDQVEFLIAGDGSKSHRLHAMASGLHNLQFLGWLGAGDLARLFARCHVAIACYARRATQSVTYKLFDYLAAGLPILCSLPGEMAEIIQREQLGFQYEAEDQAAFVEIVRQVCRHSHEISAMSHRARRFAEANGDQRQVYNRMAHFLESITRKTEFIPVES